MNLKFAIAAAAITCGVMGPVGTALAEPEDYYTGVMGLVDIYDKRIHQDNGYGGRYYFGVPLSPGALNLEFNIVGYDSNPNHKEYVHWGQYGGGLDLSFLLPKFSEIRPFFILGGGLIWSDGGGFGNSQNSYANIGMGGSYDLSRRWSIRTEARGVALFPDSKNNGVEDYSEGYYTDILVGLGLTYTFVDELPATVRETVRVVEVPAAAPAACSDADGDGVCDNLDQCPDTPVGVAVDARGCPFDTDGDGVPDYLDKCPNTTKGLKVDADGCVHGAQTIVLQNVNFEFNKDTLTPEAQEILKGVALGLVNQPGLKVEIGGHTDSKGSDSYNLKLSDRRAASARRFLVAQGVPNGQLTSKGYGEAVPIDSNVTDEGRARNRRVEFKVLSD